MGKLQEKYKDERQMVLDKMLKILNVVPVASLFFAEDITDEKEQELKDLIPEIHICGVPL